MIIHKFYLPVILLSLLCGCTNKSGTLQQRAGAIPSLVALWDFGGENYLTSKNNPVFTFETVPGINSPALSEEGPLSGQSLLFDGEMYLHIPYEKTGALDIHTGQVTVVAWIKWSGGMNSFVGGMWNESSGGGTRQYGLFVSLPYYNGEDKVCGHVSKTGKPTPPFPFSIDYSASPRTVPVGEWCMVGFTYDGTYIRSYLDGVFEEAEPELIDNTTGFEGYPDGLVQCKNPYYFPDGLGSNGSDFTLGAVIVHGRPGNFFHGRIGGLAVYDRALTPAEMSSLALR